jgi:hypothetical protein
MTPPDSQAPGWEHAVIYALEAHSGVEIARRTLPDPVPVAAMVVQGETVHVVATRRGEPIYWYALSAADLTPQHRLPLVPREGGADDDVLDAWATPGGGLWLELDHFPSRARAYAFAEPAGAPPAVRLEGGPTPADGPAFAQDACAGDSDLFVPVDGRWTASSDHAAPPTLSRLDRGEGSKDEVWARASLVGPHARIHALGSDGTVYGVTAAEDPGKPDRMRVEAFAVDRASGALRWRAHDDRIAASLQAGGAARTARRPNGELLFQRLAPDGVPCTPLVCARPDGRLDTILLGARGPYVLDAALGDLVLAHREGKDRRVEVGGFAIDHAGRLLGRRAVPSWTLDVGDLGSETTVYAGAGLVVVRGARGICGVGL